MSQGGSEIRALGRSAWAAATFAFSDGFSQRAAEAYTSLHQSDHPILIMTGEHDKVVPPGEVRATLRRIERAAGLPDGHFPVVVLPRLPHSPWFLSADVKLAQFDAVLQTQEQPQNPR